VATVSALRPIAGFRVAYLFGSRAVGKERPDSDLDLAVVFDRALDTAGREEARRDILDALHETAGTRDMFVDLVALRRTDSAVAFRALREGVLALARTPEDRVATEVFIGRSYDDDA
jgi:predicted nucleotidyltransferase